MTNVEYAFQRMARIGYRPRSGKAENETPQSTISGLLRSKHRVFTSVRQSGGHGSLGVWHRSGTVYMQYFGPGQSSAAFVDGH